MKNNVLFEHMVNKVTFELEFVPMGLYKPMMYV